MAKIAIPLSAEYQRPVIELYGVEALVDTGAVIPMFSLPSIMVEKVFAGEKLLGNQYIGGEALGDVYRLPDFKIGEITYSPLEVFVPRKGKLSFPILLSDTLFLGTSYTVDTAGSRLVIDTKDTPATREFKILSLKGKLYPQIDGVLIQDTGLLLNDAFLP